MVESQDVPDVLSGFHDHTQTVLEGTNLTRFDTLLDDLDRVLIVEPNTDRLLYWTYRNELEEIEEYLPPEFIEMTKRLKLDDDESESIDVEEAYPDLREKISIQEFAEGMIQLQEDFNADVCLAPYFPIELKTYSEDLDINIELYNKANELTDLPVEPVIPLKTSVLGADAGNTGGRLHSPQEWIDIIQGYRELDPDIFYIKATNSEFDPDTLHKTDNQGIYQFFNLLRRFSNRPAFFLGLDELAYILTQDGLDGYSRPLYKNPYRMPKTNGNGGGNHSHHRKMLLARDWSWEKFDQISDLGCNCFFCQEYQGVEPQNIELPDQDDLRISHWLALRDEEMAEIREAIENDEVRPGLQSICNDSEWRKNFTTFI